MDTFNTTIALNSTKAFADAVLAEPQLAAKLAACGPDEFAGACVSAARDRGIVLDQSALGHRSQPDPLGLSRFDSPLVQGPTWPPAPWLPIAINDTPDGLCVDWCWFGAQPLREPFFEQSAVRAAGTPFGQMFRYRMALDDFIATAETAESLIPDGFIFHMSRCGSTLAAQVMGALPHSIAISEAPPIDAMLNLPRRMTDDSAVQALRGIVASYGRRRAGDETRYVIKLDSWHAIALPLFERAFPTVPWVFLYRDPVEVLVSQARQAGAQFVPDFVAPEIYGLDADPFTRGTPYAARVLACICAAAAKRLPNALGLAVNYRELPAAVETRILPHFNITFDAGERDLMSAAARRDAKQPFVTFASDTARKNAEATPELRALAELHVGDIFRRLDAVNSGL